MSRGKAFRLRLIDTGHRAARVLAGLISLSMILNIAWGDDVGTRANPLLSPLSNCHGQQGRQSRQFNRVKLCEVRHFMLLFLHRGRLLAVKSGVGVCFSLNSGTKSRRRIGYLLCTRNGDETV